MTSYDVRVLFQVIHATFLAYASKGAFSLAKRAVFASFFQSSLSQLLQIPNVINKALSICQSIILFSG